MRTLWGELWRSPRRATRDLVWLGLAALAIIVIGYVFHLPERLDALFLAFGAGEGEVGYVLGVLAAGLVVFGLRRWGDTLRAQERARNVFDEAAVGMFQSTSDGRLLRVNTALARILGYESPKELTLAFRDSTLPLYVNPGDRAALLELLSDQGVAHEFQYQLYRKDGAKIWLETNARLVRDAHGTIVYIEGTSEDITARKETEDAYRRLVDQSLQGILIVQNQRLVFANLAASEIFGLPVEELMALSFEELARLIPPEDRQMVQMRIRARLRGENVPSRSVFQVIRPGGAARWVEIAANRIEYRGAPAVLAMMADVTERKRAQDEMQVNMERSHRREELSAQLARADGDLNAAANTLARVMVSAIGQSCVVLLVSADRTSLEPVAYYHTNTRLVNRIRELIKNARIPLQEQLYAKTVETGQPLLMEKVDAAGLEQLGVGPFARSIKHFRAFSLLVMPLRAQARTIGIVAVTRHLPEPPFQPGDQYLLQELADRAALAIANAQLTEQLHGERDARRDAEEKYRALSEQAGGDAGRELPESLARAFVWNTVDFYVAMDAGGRILFINRAVEDLIGRAPEQVVGKSFADYVRSEDVPLVYKQLELMMANSQRAQRFPVVHVRAKSGEWRLMDAVAINRLEDPNTRAILFVARDVTEQVAEQHARENAEAAAREQHALAQALGDAAALLNRATNTEEVLDGILEVVARIVPYDTASVFMRDGPVLRLARGRGFEKYGLGDWIENVTFPADMERFQLLVQDHAPIVMGDTREYGGWVRLPETEWIRSNVTAPLCLARETVGMIGLDSATPHFYVEEHGARLMAFGDLAAAALENARLMDETRRRAGAFQALSETTRDLAIQTETPLLLETIVERAMLLMHCEVGYLYSSDQTRRDLKLVVCRGLELPADYRLSPGEDLAGQIALMQRAIYINDYPSYERRVADLTSQGIRAALGVPIIYGGELVGVLGVAERQPQFRFDDSAAELLSLFAGHAASVLATSRLLEETRLRAEQLALLYDVGLTLNRVLDAQTQLEFLLKIAKRALRADSIAYFRFDGTSGTVVYELGVAVPDAVEQKLQGQALSVEHADSAVGWVAANRVPALIPLVKQDTRWKHGDSDPYSVVGVPVEHEKDLRGVLFAGRYRPESFTAPDERVLILFANQVAAAMELTRLFQAQMQRQHELEILREASLAFAAAADREALTTMILQFALRLVTAQNAFLYFYHDGQLEFGGMLWAEDSPTKPEHFTPREDGLTYTVARKGRVIVIDDVNTDPMYATWRWGGAIIGLPLKGEGQVRAVLNVAHSQVHHFLPEELRALELLTDQAAVALENARHMEETRQQLRIAQLLYQAGEALNRNLSFEETLERLADFFMQAVEVQMCCISRVDRKRGEVEVLLDRDPLPETRAAPGTRFAMSDYPYLKSVMESKRSFALRRDQANPGTPTARIMNQFHWHSLLALPLFSGDEVIGIVELADQVEGRDFSADQVRLVESLAHQAATALHNAQVLREARERAEERTRVGDATSRL